MTKWKQVFQNVCIFITNKKQKYLSYISIQTLYYETRRCILFPLIILEMFLQLDLVNSIDWKLFGKAHTCLYKVPQLTVQCLRKNKATRSKELSIEPRDRIVSRHRSGEGYQKMSAELKVPKNTAASIILKCKKFETTKTHPRAGLLVKLSNRGRRTLVWEVTENLMVSLTKL